MKVRQFDLQSAIESIQTFIFVVSMFVCFRAITLDRTPFSRTPDLTLVL